MIGGKVPTKFFTCDCLVVPAPFIRVFFLFINVLSIPVEN
jgi:hypothetical protein